MKIWTFVVACRSKRRYCENYTIASMAGPTSQLQYELSQNDKSKINRMNKGKNQI